MTADKSKIRMNLAAIKKVDPYAKDIVDSSSHVAFYTFNSEQNEWEKTDVEGAFFIYIRNAQPFYSIFINNRLNTNSFVEPITAQLELQSQPPFLLYRNERSRIRGFWFYNSEECDRIGNLVITIIQKQTCVSRFASKSIETSTSTDSKQSTTVIPNSDNVNIFKMLSKAQQEYNNLQTAISSQQNVLNFFASAKPTTSEVPFFQRVLSNTLSVEQLEKQQRVKTPLEDAAAASAQLFEEKQLMRPSLIMPQSESVCVLSGLPNFCSNFKPTLTAVAVAATTAETSFGTTELDKSLGETQQLSLNKSPITEKDQCLTKILVGGLPHSTNFVQNNESLPISSKPALMPPTMFDKPNHTNTSADTFMPSTVTVQHQPEPLTPQQLVQAFSYLMQSDEDFVHKLHEAYLKTVLNTYQ